MDKKEKKLLSVFLKDVKEEFSNHGCNDVDIKLFKNWTMEELKEFNHKLNLYNGISDPNDDQYVKDAYSYDWWIIGYFSELLKTEAV